MREGRRGARRTLETAATAMLLVTLGLLATAATVGASSASTPPRSPSAALRVGPYGAANNNWTMYMGNVEHTSDVADSPSLNASTAANLTEQWSYQTGGTIVSEPIVANDHVYVGSWDGNEYSLNASNGGFQWASYTGQSYCTAGSRSVGVSSTASLTPSALYVGGGKNYWEAISPTSGKILWNVFTGNSNGTRGDGYYDWSSPLVYGGYAYIGIASHCSNPLVPGQLLKVSLATHQVVGWFNTTVPSVLGATIWSSPAIDPATGTVYFATGDFYATQGNNSTLDDSMVAVNASTMGYVSHFQVPYHLRIIDGDFGASVTLFSTANGTPMVGDANKDGYYFALNRTNLSRGPLWATNLSFPDTYSSAAFAFGNLYVGSGQTTNAKGHVINGALRSLNATTGRVNWEDRLQGQVFGPVVVAGNVVVVSGGDELVVARQSNGAVLWNTTLGAQVFGGPSVAGGRIFQGDVTGTFYWCGRPPAAHATASATAGAAPLTVAFTGAAYGGAPSYDFRWSFGGTKSSIAQDPSHTFSVAGNYAVTLTVTDKAGTVATTSVTVVISDAAPRRRGRGSAKASRPVVPTST
jgi:polyvinyl alcohol dehydrogenase (cytochrome)